VRVLVVGGTGFVSGAIARHLRARGHEVIAYHRGRTPGDPAIEHICSPQAVIPVMTFPEIAKPDVVVHAVPVGDADARAVVAAYPGTRIIAISSGDVYKVYGALRGLEEAPPPGPLREDSPLRRVEYPYGPGPVKSPWGHLTFYEKIHVERAVLAAGGTALRLGRVYGRGDDALTPWLRAMRSMGRDGEIGIERAHWRWTHVYVEDVGEAVALAAENERAAGCVYNVGESKTPTQLERFHQLARAAGIAVRTAPALEPTPPDLVLDSSKIRHELGFRETPFERALVAVVGK